MSWMNLDFSLASSVKRWIVFVVPRSKHKSNVLIYILEEKVYKTMWRETGSKWKLNSAAKNYLIPKDDEDPPMILTIATLLAN